MMICSGIHDLLLQRKSKAKSSAVAQLRLTVTCFICMYFIGGSTLFSVVEARTLKEIEATKEIRFCLAGSAHDFYRKNAMALAEYLDNGIHPIFIQFDHWDDQFVNDHGVVIRDGEYTPEPLASGKCDLYPNDLVKVKWRENKIAYVSLFISRNTIIVNKAHMHNIMKPQDLAGKTAAVMKGTSYHSWLDDQNRGRFKDNPIKLVFMPQEEALKAAEAGDVDFGIIGADGALWATKTFAPNIHVAFPVGKTTEYGWCFQKADKDLQEAVEQFFAAQRKSLDSPLNKNWIEHTGLTLGEFILFVTSTPEPTDN